MSRLGLPCLLAAAVFFCLLYALADYDLTTGYELPPHSSLRYDPFGTSGLRELLLRRGWKTQTLQRPVPPDDADATLVMLPLAEEEDDNDDSRFGSRRLQRIEEWVRSGNRLLILSRRPPAPLARRLEGLSFAGASGIDRTLQKKQASGDYRGAMSESPTMVPVAGSDSTLFLVSPGGMTVEDDAEADVLAGERDGAKAVELPLGDGRVIVVADSTPALNIALGEASNAEFLLARMGKGTVYFDEYSLGLGDVESTMDWLKRYSLLPFLLQAGLALFLLARSGDRGGRPPAVPERKQTTPAGEQIRILASLYENTLSDGTLADKRRRLRGRLRDGP